MLGPSLRMKKNESTLPPLGLKHLVPNFYFAFSCCPRGTLVRFPCVCVWGGGGGGGAHSSWNASLSQSNVQKNSKAIVKGMGGLKIWKQSTYLRKNWAYFPCILYFFIHPKPKNTGPARQEPRDLGSLNFSESGRRRGGGGHSYYLFALPLLDYMRFAMEASTEWQIGGGGGGTHSSPTALGLGISAPPQHTQNFRFLLWTGRGYKSVLSSATRLQEI